MENKAWRPSDAAISKSESRRHVAQLPPGSPDAVERGCACPVLDNRRGIGGYCLPDGEYIINGSCAIHGLLAGK